MCPRTWLVELNIECLDLWPDCQVLLYDVVISLLWIRTRVDVVADSVVVILTFSYVWELNLNWLVMCRTIFCQDMWYHYQLDHLRTVCCTLLKWWYTFCLIFLLLWPEKIYLSYISLDLACRENCMCTSFTRFWPEGSVLWFYYY